MRPSPYVPNVRKNFLIAGSLATRRPTYSDDFSFFRGEGGALVPFPFWTRILLLVFVA